MRSGVPAVGGISTQAITGEAIAGELDGGASAGEAAEDLGPDTGAVRRAQGYELSQRAALGPRAAQVRIYVDADVQGRGQDPRRPPQRHDLPRRSRSRHPQAGAGTVPDHQPGRARHRLVPQVAARGGLIITRDATITQNRNEITAAREDNAKTAALNQRDAQTKRGPLEVFMTQWRRIEALTTQGGPFIWRTSRTAMTPIALD